MAKKQDNNPIEKQFVFNSDNINEIIDKQSQGYALPRYMNPWFKNQTGVRKAGCVYGWTQHELDEFTKCAVDIHYFANNYCQIKTEDGQIRQMKLRDYQYNVLNTYTKNRFTLNMSSRQTGKDQPLTSLLWTDMGPIQMGDVTIGQKIFDPNGELTEVIGIYPQGEKDVYEITLSDGMKVKCGYEHLWGVQDIKGNYKVLSLKEILDNGYLTNRGDYKYFIETTKPVNYSKKELIMDPYLLGLFIGDGCISQKKTAIATDDQEIVDYLKHFETDELKIKKGAKFTYNFSKTVDAKNNYINHQLKDLGLKTKLSHNKFIPKDYLYSSIEDRLELLRGLMDSDGSINDKSNIEYSTVSKQLGDDITELCQSLGIVVRRTTKTSNYTYKGEYKTGKLVYRLKLQLPNDYPHDIFKLTRKQSLVRNKKYDWGYRRGIANIELIGKEQTQCIEVNNESHLYLTDNYIPTHNTITAAITLLHYCIFNTNKGVMIVANKGDTVIEILDKIKNIYKLLPFFMKPGIINWNQKAMVFENGCRIKSQARSKEPAIGFTIDFLYMDEFAHIPRNIINHYYKAAIPTVSSIKGSKIVITSTPNGANLFKDLVMGAMLPEGHPDKNMYNLIKVLWWQVPDGKFDDGTNGTRLDPKLYPIDKELSNNGETLTTMMNQLNKLGFKTVREVETTDTGEKPYIRILHEEKKSDIELIKNLKLNKLSATRLFNITNWQEQETKLIGGEEAFNQEYNIQFIAGSKRVLSASKAKILEDRSIKYKFRDIELLTKRLKFEYNELRWAPDYIEQERDKYFWVPALDISEGLGLDDTVINIFRLMVRPPVWLQENKIRTMYDAFYLKQTGIYNYNRIDPELELSELFYLLFFEYINPERVKSVVEYNGPGSTFLASMVGVFDGHNQYGNYIFARYKHRQEDKKKKVGLKVTRNKKYLVKKYIDCVESDKLYVDEHETLAQMDNFIKVETRSGDFTYKADSGHDDIVMTEVGAATYFDTQEFKNMCLEYYKELSSETQTAIDKALDIDYNPDVVSYRSLSKVLAKSRNGQLKRR